ncbi:unnamed protein product [Heligmosomoides polygyrus]|uniref:Uncharacterized protein n=1 Tax=Heligmosomoides polygyrus TaxID=6339 RepID=A0A3P7UFK5_HELPZ|nr:unnamed protein product [Heligmosomoides polygyrus]
MTDVSVVTKFYAGSDHHLLRARFCFSLQGEKAAKFKKRSPRTIINWDLYTPLAGLWKGTVMDNIDEEYDRFVHHLCDSAKRTTNKIIHVFYRQSRRLASCHLPQDGASERPDPGAVLPASYHEHERTTNGHLPGGANAVDFDRVCGSVGLQLNLTKTMFMKNGWERWIAAESYEDMFMRNGQVSDAPFSLNGTSISECSSYVYLGREEDEERPTPCPPIRLYRSSCPNIRL